MGELWSNVQQCLEVLAANHGAFCCGRDLAEALVVCQIVERAAFMMLATAGMGALKVIPDEAVSAERHRFLHKYGTTDDVP